MMENVCDIMSGNGYPSGELSNLAAHNFEFDGIQIAGMEGFLQALKFSDPEKQKQICKLSGRIAKKTGSKQKWQNDQTLYWMGKQYNRHSDEYQILLDNAYDQLFFNKDFQKALLATGDCKLTHSIGSSDPTKTILTEREFCDRLTHLRDILSFGVLFE